jgi:hypothetical protein
MKNALLITLTIIILSLSSCSPRRNDAQQVTQNGDFKVEYLFTQDDCKVYRFQDGKRYIYWSDCRGKIQADYTESNGKTSTTHYEETITVE